MTKLWIAVVLLISLVIAGGSAEAFRDDKIYIDSVPRGALVSLLPREEKGESVNLGTTPLVLDPSQVPSMRFCIMIGMDDYLKAIEPIAALKDWVRRFNADQRFTTGGVMRGQDYFAFEDTPKSQVAVDPFGRLIAVGPVYILDWPKVHRLVALFIPKGVKASVFYPLMPPSGTFDVDERAFGDHLVTDEGFSPEQRDEALGSLSRCGKYITKVKAGNDTARVYSISAQKGLYMSMVSVIRVIPGVNDDY